MDCSMPTSLSLTIFWSLPKFMSIAMSGWTLTHLGPFGTSQRANFRIFPPKDRQTGVFIQWLPSPISWRLPLGTLTLLAKSAFSRASSRGGRRESSREKIQWLQVGGGQALRHSDAGKPKWAEGRCGRALSHGDLENFTAELISSLPIKSHFWHWLYYSVKCFLLT